MRYAYIIETINAQTGEYIERDYDAFSNFNECKEYVAIYAEQKCRRANREVENDKELTYNGKFDYMSSYQWTENGEYTRRQLEEMKFKSRINGFAECKIKVYEKFNDRYIMKIFYLRIDRHRLK